MLDLQQFNVGVPALGDFVRLKSPSQPGSHAKTMLRKFKYPSHDEIHPFFGLLPRMPRR